jgi:murein DD-endopeptidase MepM/ murein hydrolase activator NlpD
MAIATAVSGRVSDIGTTAVFSSNEQPAATSAAAGYLKPPVIVSTVPGILARHQAEAVAMGVEAPADPTAAVDASATPAAAQSASFVYTIQPGDTIDSIAAAFGINPAYILWNNPITSSDPDLLLVGETLVVPSIDGILYNVSYGDTLSGIAAAYGVGMDSIVGYGPNGLASPDAVVEGMVLLLPGAVPPAPPEPEPVYVAEDPYEEPSGGSGGGAPVSAGAAVSAPIPAPSYGFIWPFYGNITTYFSGGHRGIDIDGFGAYGAPIAAAGTGTVVAANWSDWGYGYHVVIDHGDGTQTLYGHLSEIWVSPGEYVGQGQAIGALGSTGYSTGPHLHFEIHVGGVAVNPLNYLG